MLESLNSFIIGRNRIGLCQVSNSLLVPIWPSCFIYGNNLFILMFNTYCNYQKT